MFVRRMDARPKRHFEEVCLRLFLSLSLSLSLQKMQQRHLFSLQDGCVHTAGCKKNPLDKLTSTTTTHHFSSVNTTQKKSFYLKSDKKTHKREKIVTWQREGRVKNSKYFSLSHHHGVCWWAKKREWLIEAKRTRRYVKLLQKSDV